MFKRIAAAALGSWIACVPGLAMSGQILDAVRTRGELSCGVRFDTLGFAHKDAKGEFSGLDVDMCRAVAAALFGDARKAKYTPIVPDRRFDMLREGNVDMLSSGTIYTLTRETSMGLHFPVIYYYDTQAFMVLRKLGRKSLREMKGATVCVQTGRPTGDNVRDWSALNKMDLKPMPFQTLEEMRKAFFGGKCDLYTDDRSAVFATRQAHAEIPQEYTVFPESISDEPLGLVVREADRNFSEVVRWSFYALVMAETLGITSRNVDEMTRSENPAVKRFLGVTPGDGKALGLDEKWAFNIIKQVGNYGEVYERNLGAGSQLKIPRNLNSLTSQGGMIFSPPFR